MSKGRWQKDEEHALRRVWMSLEWAWQWESTPMRWIWRKAAERLLDLDIERNAIQSKRKILRMISKGDLDYKKMRRGEWRGAVSKYQWPPSSGLLNSS